MIGSEVVTDETGLHSADCDCVRCALGYRPTELERSAARRALVLRRKREAEAAARLAGLKPGPATHRRDLPPYRVPAPLTAEQRAELEQLRKQIGKRP